VAPSDSPQQVGFNRFLLFQVVSGTNDNARKKTAMSIFMAAEPQSSTLIHALLYPKAALFVSEYLHTFVQSVPVHLMKTLPRDQRIFVRHWRLLTKFSNTAWSLQPMSVNVCRHAEMAVAEAVAMEALSCIVSGTIAHAMEIWNAYRSRDDQRRTLALYASFLVCSPVILWMWRGSNTWSVGCLVDMLRITSIALWVCVNPRDKGCGGL
jgi:hypothetical protein